MRKITGTSLGESPELSRKEKRKLVRKQKKERKNQFYQRKTNHHPQSSSQSNHNNNSTKTNQHNSHHTKLSTPNKQAVNTIKNKEGPLKNKQKLENKQGGEMENRKTYQYQQNTKSTLKITNNSDNRIKQTKKGSTNALNSTKLNNEKKIKAQDNIIKNEEKRKIKNDSKGKKTEKELQNEAELLRQQREIAYYESLLGVGKKKNKYKNIAKGMGYEDDLFDFLENISKTVNSSNYEYQSKYKQNNQMEQYDQQHGLSVNMNQDSDNIQEEEDSENIQSDQDYIDQDEENIQIHQQDEPAQQSINEEFHSNIDDSYYSQNPQSYNQEFKEENNSADSNQFQPESDGSLDEQQEGSLDEEQEGSLDEEQQAMWNQLQNQTIPQKPSQNNLIKNNHQHTLQNSTSSNPNPLSKSKTNPTSQPKSNVDQPLKQLQQERKPLFGNMTPQQKQQQQIRKQMNGLFNKLSDGNLMITFRQFSQIFLSSSKSNTIPVFINLFVRFNVEVEKPHLHILLSNIALASALHHLIGNRLMAPLLYQLVHKFQLLQNSQQDLEEIKEIGYSKLFQKKKNIIMILSYLYDFKSLTGEFIYSLVQKLARSLNEHHIEFLYIIIQKIGNKIRQNDPGVLKEIVDTLRESIQVFKNSESKEESQMSKINIIELELNEIKFNRKQPLFNDQRMAFFTTFLTKNVPNQISTQKEILLANYDQIRNADTSHTNWWQNLTNPNPSHKQEIQNEQDIQILNEITAERKQLLQLAKSLNLVTEIRKNIFIEIMQASDYIEATQKVLMLKIKNLQEIAVVLLQVCVLEPTFNPFYPLVAAKIANINPKFKSKVQFTIWDHVKLIDSYDPRKISNLAKFTARFVANPLTNGSLSILKYFPDLINIAPEEAMFLVIFFKEFLSISKKPIMVQISKKLKEEGNRQIKEAVLEYLNEVGVREKGFDNMEKMKFLRRIILVNENQNNEEEF